jgi:hypothetical protein
MSNNGKWEYRVETFGSSFSAIKDDVLEETLNEWADEGWEIVSAHNIGENKVRIIMGRLQISRADQKRGWP